VVIKFKVGLVLLRNTVLLCKSFNFSTLIKQGSK